jgi:starch synthase
MPSRSEHCGLSQMIAMRYGTAPVVRETGGLRDTVSPYMPSAGTGFTFANYDADDMLGALQRALTVYADRKEWLSLRKRCMSADFSWSRSAAEYLKIYRDLAEV